MNSNYIECPNGGKCGHKKHQIGSYAYKQCVRRKSMGVSKAPFAPMSITGLTGRDKEYIDRSRLGSMTRAFRKSGAYMQPDSPIFSGISMSDDQVQQYIDNPRGISFTADQEHAIKEGINTYIESIADDVDIDLDELSPEEIDMVRQAAYNAINARDVMHGIADRMAPRTFTYNCFGDRDLSHAAAALDDATARYVAGSDEWYYILSRGYLDDMTSRWGGLRHGKPGDVDVSAEELSRQAIAFALKGALGENPGEIDSDSLPRIDIVWTGSLSDVSPRQKYSQKAVIQSPHIIATDSTGSGDRSVPARLSGMYSVAIPDVDSASEGRTSGIRDDLTSASGPLFNYSYSVGPGIEIFKTKVVTY